MHHKSHDILTNIHVAYYLNPRFQYRSGVGEDPKLIEAVHEVFSKLDPNSRGLSQFGNEVQSILIHICFNIKIIVILALRTILITY